MTKKQMLLLAVPTVVIVLLSIIAVLIVTLTGNDNNKDIPAGNSIVTEKSDDASSEATTTKEENTSDAPTTTEPVTTEPVTTTEVPTTPALTTSKREETTEEESTTRFPNEYIDADISAFINEQGSTVQTRFKVPEGFQRVVYGENSFSTYLQNLPLKPHGSKIYLFDGEEKVNQTWHGAVIDMKLPSNGWLQCADCVMKLIADYLYENGRYGDITFDFVSGLEVPFKKWSEGYRVEFNSSGTKAWLEKKKDESTSEKTYQQYMNIIYCYSNTASLKDQDESKNLKLKNIFPGAYFIVGPNRKLDLKLGHAVIVVDTAINPETGEVAFLLAQGNTPSENMHIVLNPLHNDDPWYYSSEIGETFVIQFREFKTKDLFYYAPIGLPTK